MTPYSDREARLVPTLINVLVAGMCDPSRLQKGRTYARQGAVMDVRVASGELLGYVQGSRSIPYEVVVHVSAATDFDKLVTLVPTARDIRVDCSCPDWESMCKHAVAAMATFAERVGSDPQLLATWRGAPTIGSGPRAVVGSRSTRPSIASGPKKAPAPEITAEALAAVEQFLGKIADSPARPARELPHLAGLAPPRPDGWDDPWATMLDSAVAHLGRHTRKS